MTANLQIALILVFPALAILAALKDMVSYTIPNWMSAAMGLAFLVTAPLVGASWPMIGAHLGVGVAALVVGMGLFALGWIGGGDAKLFAAAGLWLGWPAVEPFLLATTVAGGALSVLLLGLRSPLVRAHTPGGGWIERLATPNAPAPYGVAIACGALAAFPGADIVRLAHLPL